MASRIKMKLQCRFCAGKFEWFGEEFPDECPICHRYIGIDGEQQVAAPYISLKSARAADGIYRAMENGSEHRANMAAEMLGVPKSEVSDLKITNLRDVKQNEVPIPRPDPTPVTMAMAAQPGAYGFGGAMGHDVNSIKSMTQGQPGAGAALGMISRIRDNHARNGGVVTTFPTPDTAAGPRRF